MRAYIGQTAGSVKCIHPDLGIYAPTIFSPDNRHALWTIAAGGVCGFLLSIVLMRLSNLRRDSISWAVDDADAVGLGTFAVLGYEKSLLLHPLLNQSPVPSDKTWLFGVFAAILGMLTSAGGGILRDVLLLWPLRMIWGTVASKVHYAALGLGCGFGAFIMDMAMDPVLKVFSSYSGYLSDLTKIGVDKIPFYDLKMLVIYTTMAAFAAFRRLLFQQRFGGRPQ